MLLRTFILPLMVAFAPMVEAATLTFNELTPGSQVGLSYEADGFTLTGTPRFSSPWYSPQFYVLNQNDVMWTGSPGLALGGVGSEIKLNSSNGGLFDAVSIDISRADNYGGLIPVSFLGIRGDGVNVGATYQFTDRVLGRNQTFLFGDNFRNLRTLIWYQGAEFHQFDNVVVEEVTAVPEPSTLWLFAPLVAALSLWSRKRPRVSTVAL